MHSKEQINNEYLSILKTIHFCIGKKMAAPSPSPIQTILSALESHQNQLLRSRAKNRIILFPPVGNYTLPRR